MGEQGYLGGVGAGMDMYVLPPSGARVPGQGGSCPEQSCRLQNVAGLSRGQCGLPVDAGRCYQRVKVAESGQGRLGCAADAGQARWDQVMNLR
jgi:hypothetical protein